MPWSQQRCYYARYLFSHSVQLAKGSRRNIMLPRSLNKESMCHSHGRVQGRLDSYGKICYRQTTVGEALYCIEGAEGEKDIALGAGS